MPLQHVGGWRIDKEDFDFLYSLPGESDVLAMRGSYTEVAFDPRKVLRVENQGSVGSCQGHSISSCAEWCYILATGDTKLQLSRAYGYYESQRLDGLLGQDRGSTVASGVKLAMTKGICPEELWRYSGKYDPKPPHPIQEIYEAAAKYKIGRQNRLTTYEGIRTHLGSGQGPVHIGIEWNSSVNRALVNSYSTADGGGHSIGLYTLSERKDSQGRPYIWMMNSWDKTWGNEGWAEWAPVAVEAMLRQRWTVMIGLSEMPTVKPREWTLEDVKKQVKWWVAP
jgi:hypothetical protein